MSLPNTVAIIVPRSNPFTRSMANRHMKAISLREMIVRSPFIGIDSCPWLRGFEYSGFKVFTCAVVFHFQLDLTTFSTNNAQNRWAVSIPGTMPTSFISTATWGIIGIGMLDTFFTGILVHFIDLRHLICQRCSNAGFIRKVLELMATFQ